MPPFLAIRHAPTRGCEPPFHSFTSVFAAVSLALSTLASCKSPSAHEDPSAHPVGEPDRTPIGIELSLTENLGPFGQGEQAGMTVATRQLNSLGGVLGRRVEVHVADDASDPQLAISVWRGLADAGALGVIGPTGSDSAMALQALAHAARLPLISPSASTPTTRLAEPCPDRYFFRTSASHALQAKALAILAHRGLQAPSPNRGDDAGATGNDASGPQVVSCHRLAVIHTDDGYGDPIASGIRTETQALGGSVVLDIPVPATAQSVSYYAGLVEQLIRATPAPDCQILVSLIDVGSAYMRAFQHAIQADHSRDWSAFVSIGSNGLASPSFLVLGRDNPADTRSPTAGEGMYVMNLDVQPPTRAHQEFVNLYGLFYPLDAGEEPPGYAANTYDAVILLALAIQAAGTVSNSARIRDELYAVSRPPGTAITPAQVADGLRSIQLGYDINYEGASGAVDLDDCGEVTSGYVVSRVLGGAFVDWAGGAVSVADLQ